MRARPVLRMLDDPSIDRVHAASLRVLGEVGVCVQSDGARRLLREAGARADDDTRIVRLPPDLVEWAIATAPKSVLLSGRDPARDCALDHTRTFTTLDGIGAFVLDHRTGERRPSTSADLAAAMRVADATDELDVQWYIVNPTEQPPKLENLRGVATMLANTGKHVQAEVLHPEDVPYVMELLRLAAPDGEWRRERPFFSAVYCPVAPLQHDEASMDAALLLARQGVPQTVFSLALAGATAPPTLAGTVVQTNCDVLSAFVVLQLAAPGCPLIYVANSAAMDMRSATYASAGPEAILINTALTDVGRRYGLPVLTCGFSSDAKRITMQAGAEGAPLALASFLTRPDVVTGMGMLDSAQLLYLPKIVLDAEVKRVADRVVEGIGLDDDDLAVDLMARTGPGGHYLKAKETRRHLRSGEHLVPQYFMRSSYDAWEADPRSELDRATERVEQILAEHKTLPLPQGASEAMEEVLARAASELPER